MLLIVLFGELLDNGSVSFLLLPRSGLHWVAFGSIGLLCGALILPYIDPAPDDELQRPGTGFQWYPSCSINS